MLTENFSSVQQLLQAPYDTLVTIKGIGKEVAYSIRSWFSLEENQKLISELDKNGFVLENKNLGINQNKPDKQIFFNITFVITGSLNTLKRSEIKNLIENFGGKVVNSVTKKTNYILVGENPGSKLAEGIKLNIIRLNETDFLRILKDADIEINEI